MRRTRKKNISISLKRFLRFAFKRYPFCQWCNRPLIRLPHAGNSTIATVDHIIPKSKGGNHLWDNLCISCVTCNQLKNNDLWDREWMYGPLDWEIVRLEEKSNYLLTHPNSV